MGGTVTSQKESPRFDSWLRQDFCFAFSKQFHIFAPNVKATSLDVVYRRIFL